MSMLFQGVNHIPGIGKGSLLGMATFTYIVLTVVPGALLANSLFTDFSVVKLLVLSCLLAVSTYAILMRIKNLSH